MAGMMDSTKEKLIEGQKNTFTLIEGVFKPADAATLLFNLISDKVKFHNTLVLTAYEQTSSEVSKKSQKRIDELVASKNEINELVKQAKSEGFELKVNSEITIEITKK